MAALSDYLENRVLDWLLRGQPYAPPATVHVALLVAAPGDGGGLTEVSGGGYARSAIVGSLANWAGTQGAGTTVASTGSSGETSNNITVAFPAPSAAWGIATHFAVLDAATGGNLLFRGALVQAKTINAGDAAPSFPAGSLVIQVDD